MEMKGKNERARMNLRERTDKNGQKREEREIHWRVKKERKNWKRKGR